jgi:hypothetical protein
MTPADLIEMYESALDPPSLQGLSAVDWSAVSHAYGPATDVPALLRAFVSAVPDHHKFACELLFQTIWHQGTVYAATAVAVPFLYQLLEGDGVPDKSAVAHLLATIAEGHSYLACHANTPQMAATWASLLAKDGKNLDAELAREMGHVGDAKREVARKLDVLYQYLRDPEPEVRRSVAVAVGCFPEIAARLLPDLKAAYRDEVDKYAREALGGVIDRLPNG